MICKQHHTLYFFCLGLLVALLLCSSSDALANKKYASLVMDADTGVILSQSNADKMLHPASLTKVMTLMMVFDALDSGKLSLNSKIRISKRAASMVPSKLGLPAGSSIRVKDAIYALVTKSANDVAVAISEKLGKTESRFAVMMTKKARSLGMNRTRFMNASGLHHPKQVTTARDMAKMGRYLIAIQPRHYRYFKTQHFSYRGKDYRNHNRLLGQYDGMDGIKTGYIQAAGFNLLASAKRNNRRLIGVVFGGRTSKTRNAHMRDILDRGFKKIGNVRIAKAPLPIKNPRRESMNALARAKEIEDNSPQTSQLAVNLLKAQPKGLVTEAAPQELGSATHAKSAKRLNRYKNLRIEVAQLSTRQHMEYIKTPQKQSTIAPTAFNAASSNIHSFMKPDNDDHILGVLNTNKIDVSSYQDGNALQGQEWGIQIGAFSDRSKTDGMLDQAQRKLPLPLRYAKTKIAPIQVESGWVYRAWLTGFSETDATNACNYYSDCIVIAPKPY